MKHYEIPQIIELNISLEDVIALSVETSTDSGKSKSLLDIFTN